MVIPSEGTVSEEVQMQGGSSSSTESERVDHNHPLLIHPSDTQGSILTSI